MANLKATSIDGKSNQEKLPMYRIPAPIIFQKTSKSLIALNQICRRNRIPKSRAWAPFTVLLRTSMSRFLKIVTAKRSEFGNRKKGCWTSRSWEKSRNKQNWNRKLSGWRRRCMSPSSSFAHWKPKLNTPIGKWPSSSERNNLNSRNCEPS